MVAPSHLTTTVGVGVAAGESLVELINPGDPDGFSAARIMPSLVT